MWLRADLSLCIQGTQTPVNPRSPMSRFIPVYTGNATSPFLSNLGAPVYPCVYRERFRTDRVNNWQSGLSLCIQGTHYRAQEVVHRVRFIPVYTGNASRFTIQKLHLAVYPCVYRERCIEFCNIAHYLRFIPVYTGNAIDPTVNMAVLAVYPCVYRERQK